MASIWFGIIVLCVLYNFKGKSKAQSVEVDGFDAGFLNSAWSPVHEAVIVGDIADILTEIDNNPNVHWEELFNSESESDEDIEDLLSEYHHYLNKAHKQGVEYLEKNKLKNKVPLMRHETYTKNKPQSKLKTEEYFYPNDVRLPFSRKPINPLISFDASSPFKIQSSDKFDITTTQPTKLKKKMESYSLFGNRLSNEWNEAFSPNAGRSGGAFISQCACDSPQSPCDCGRSLRNMFTSNLLPMSRTIPTQPRPPFLQQLLDSSALKTVNDPYIDNPSNYVKVKVDIQIPVTDRRSSNYNSVLCSMPFGNFLDMLCNSDAYSNLPFDSILSNGYDTIIQSNSPTRGMMPFPIPSFGIGSASILPFNAMPFNNMQMEILGIKKEPKYKGEVRKLSIHKKKKSKPSINNKRHKKKLVTFHKLKLDGVQTMPLPLEENINLTNIVIHLNNLKENVSDHFKYATVDQKNVTFPIYNVTEKPKVTDNTNNGTNITKVTTESETEDAQKIENSIDTDTESKILNTAAQARIKRESIENATNINSTLKSISNIINNARILKLSKKLEKEIDDELLFWPNNSEPITSAQNITKIIFDRENHKAKINISKEALVANHRNVLEKAIFGNIDWNDVDTIAPIFMSFLGKYVTGVLTFCSDKSCHSIKCAEKLCHHRVCLPAERFAGKGHCAKSNTNDGVATMESLMDLPSNVVFETVDILQDRMLGKLFGKMTMCINSKCLTFSTTKKMFAKSKCIHKELNTLGHCPNQETCTLSIERTGRRFSIETRSEGDSEEVPLCPCRVG